MDFSDTLNISYDNGQNAGDLLVFLAVKIFIEQDLIKITTLAGFIMNFEKLLPWMIGLAPAAVVASTWSPDPTLLQENIRALSLPIVAVEIFVILFVIIERVKKVFPEIYFAIALILLLILAWVTAIIAENSNVAVIMTSIFTIHLIFGFAISSLWSEGRLSSREVILALQVGFLISVALIIAYVAIFYRSSQIWTWEIPGFRNIRHLGYYAAAIVGISALGFSKGQKLAIVTAAFAFFIAFWTVSRGAIAASLAGYIVTAFYLEVLRKRQVVFRFAACVLFGFIMSTLFTRVYPLDEVGLNRIVNGDYNGRIQLWIHTLISVQDSPWIGWGEAQLRSRLGNNFPFGQPHNIALQILHAWGLIGMALVIYLSTKMIIRIQSIFNDDMTPFAFAAITLFLLSFVDGSLYYVNSVFIFAICISIMCSLRRETAPSIVRI